MIAEKLKQYNSAKAEIPRLREEIKSMPEFIEGFSVVKASLSHEPYTEGHYTQHGFEPNPQKIRLEAKLHKLEALVYEVDEFMLDVDDVNTLRAIRIHFFDGLTWEETDIEIGYGKGGEALRKKVTKEMKKAEKKTRKISM